LGEEVLGSGCGWQGGLGGGQAGAARVQGGGLRPPQPVRVSAPQDPRLQLLRAGLLKDIGLLQLKGACLFCRGAKQGVRMSQAKGRLKERKERGAYIA
jgi:hypothetical protein